MSKTEVRRCTCAHEFQDTAYGAGHRVHNAKRIKDGKSIGWRCTVCIRETDGTVVSATAPQPVPARSGKRR